MKIKNISCTQFAGIRDRNINFDDGINVIYGKNESGKSTLVNLISRTLFQNARIDGRSDKTFRDLYFPGKVKGRNPVGDFADGTISFDTENGIFTLQKEWGSDSRCILSTPDGIIKDQMTIDSILKEILIYGEGVYADMLLSSQRNTDTALQTILDSAKKTDAKQEITNSVSQAFAESDGISLDEIEQKINAKIEEIGGKHWDFEKETPMRKAGRWVNGLGEILKAYYALEDAKNILDELSRTETEFDLAAEKYNKADAEVKIAENAYNKFNTYSGKLAVQSERRKSIERIEKELNKIRNVLAEWPKITEQAEQAKVLQKEKISRELLDKYESAKKIAEELNSIDKSLSNRPCPTDNELAQVKAAQKYVTKLENKLCGMNLNAAINLFGTHTVEVTSLRTGEKIDFSNGNADITEAVKITIPNVAEIQLSPSDIDVSAIEIEISEQKKILTDVFETYCVTNADELENIAKEISAAKTKLENTESRLNNLLGDEKFEELEDKAKNISTSVRSKEEIYNDISAFCVGDISKFIIANETVIAGYIEEYKSIAELKAKAYDIEIEYNMAKETIESMEIIPEEYLHIDDPEAHLESLKNALKAKQAEREALLKEKTTVAGKLEAYNENIENDPKEEVTKAERIFSETKSLLQHWLHIAEVFKAQKENINNNPMQDIADSFTNYLGLISDNKISSEFPDANKLNMNIYSDNRLLDYNKLSEGTKETVSLAFRLAVLDHLFPNGGGVIVLDDPFTDMDAERTEQSCVLVKECAKKHQVIFLTCREEYLGMLSGNEIIL